jgi:hypothetical protein
VRACVCASKSGNPGPERFRDLDGQDLFFCLFQVVKPRWTFHGAFSRVELASAFSVAEPALLGRTLEWTDGWTNGHICFFLFFLLDFSPLLLN